MPTQINSKMSFQVLGPVQVRRGGVCLRLSGTKQRTVLAVLLLTKGAGVPNQRLEWLLWGEHPPETAQAQIQTYIYKLRELLSPDVEIVRQSYGYTLSIPDDALDLNEFERMAEHGRRAFAIGHIEEAVKDLRSAIDLWRGPPLADVTEQLMSVEQPRLEELRIATLEDRVDVDLALGREKELVPELTRLVAQHPLRERLRGALMLALHRCGRQADALAIYRAGRQILIDETGLEPGLQLRRMHETILADDPAHAMAAVGRAAADTRGTTVVTPAPPALARRPWTGPLRARQEPLAAAGDRRPEQLPPLGRLDLVGRDKEISIALDWLQPDRPPGELRAAPVCAITGMAGVGKTALAVRVAHELRDRYPDGQLYVDLHGDKTPARPLEVLKQCLRALAADGEPLPKGHQDCLSLFRSRTAGRRMLIVLDNALTARHVRPVLPASADCGVLVTCRARLASLEGACMLDLTVLEPDQAVELLGRTAGVQRVLSEPEAAERIARLCGWLPLAIRIAGAKLAARPHWSLSRLADRLTDDRQRLDELTHDDLDLRARLAPSPETLPAAALRALRLLAELDVPMFGSWIVTALLAVPGWMAENLVDTLVDARVLEIAASEGTRDYYRFHDLVRAAVREQTAREETQATRQAARSHAYRAWLALAAEVLARLTGQVVETDDEACPAELPERASADALLADPLAWFKSERPVLEAACAQAHAEGHVLAPQLSRVLGSLELF